MNVFIIKSKYNAEHAKLPEHKVECPCCCSVVDIPELDLGSEASCQHCDETVTSIEHNPYISPLAYSVTSLILLILVSSQFFLGMKMIGASENLYLIDVMRNLFSKEYGFLANVLFALTFVTPIVYLVFYNYIFIGLYLRKNFTYFRYAARFVLQLKPWLMVDIFFIATVVAIVKIQAISEVVYGVGFWLLLAYAIVLVRMTMFTNHHWLYYQFMQLDEEPIELVAYSADSSCVACPQCLFFQDVKLDECQVCGHGLYKRRPHSIMCSFAFLLAAIILFIPANILPMMITESPITVYRSNIFDGILTLWKSNDYLVAMIIFVASVFIPIFKILSMAFLLFNIKIKLLASPLLLSKIYYFIERIGRWSMIDIFVIIILMAVYQTNIARVTPGIASMYFCLVVILTMMSTYFLDIRLLWDRYAAETEKKKNEK